MTRSHYSPLRRASLCSTLAIATSLVLGPSPAAAQSFQGTGTFTNPLHGSISTPDSATTNISITAPQAVIDWAPFPDGGASGTAINFQPSGTIATFNGSSDYAVLNRVNVVDTSRIVAMSGTIQSLIGGEVTGGSIYFYSPSGFVIGSNAVINVGSLVLSASPITVDGNGEFITGADNSVTFEQALNPAATVVTNANSVINAPQEGSYVALVAPRVEHNGTIDVNGAAALVGAEAATIKFRTGGLFDITVDVGTTDANGVAIGATGGAGVITGPESTGFGDNHRAYLVAVPKNTALTMLISAGSNLGFDIAGAAQVFDNAVILSAGHDIVSGNTSDAPSAASGADAHISIGNANFTSALYGRADGDVAARAVDGLMNFASDVSLRGRDSVTLEAWGGGNVVVGGNLLLSANADGSSEGESVIAGNITLQALGGGSLSVAGSTTLTAVGTGGFSSTTGLASGDGTGGTILVQSTSGGNISLGDSTFDTFSADASGRGGSISGQAAGGDGFGGTVNVFTSGGSSMSVAGSASVTANGRAASTLECFTCGANAGIGDGGTIVVQAHTGPDNVMAFAESLFMTANGEGGIAQTGNGGAGLGGDIIFSSTSQSSITVAGDVSISAYGSGGNARGVGGDGGAGFGGDATASADNGSLDITGSFSAYLAGNGGESEFGNGGYGEGGFGQLFANNNANVAVGLYSSIYAAGTGGSGLASGGEGQGGFAYFSSSNGGTLTLGSFSSLIADGFGGDAFDADGLGGNGGLGEGGHAEAYANNAALDVQGTLVLSADGEGGSAGGLRDAGDSLGGDVYLQALNGGDLTVAGGLYASAVGIGDHISSTTNSGDGTGGFIGIYSRDGDSTLTVTGAANLNADGVANAQGECFPCGGVGGVGQGGNIIISSQGATGLTGNVLTFADTLFATANGYGGAGVGGAAGNGLGGTVDLSAGGGNSVSVTGDVQLEAIGFGGSDFGGFVAGNGTGGTARIQTVVGNSGNAINLGANVIVDASGLGGDGDQTASGTGGNGTGGFAQVYNPAGTIDVTGDLTLWAEGYGGDASGITGIGGDGFGKHAEIFSDGGDITIDGSAFISASGYGGDGFVSGNGTGGGTPFVTGGGEFGAHIFARNGDISIGVGGVETGAFVQSNGYGGSASLRIGGGGSGGNGTGGWATITSANSDLGPSSITAPLTFLSVTGQGGDGGNGDSGGSGSPGGDGGTGTGGTAGQTAQAGNGLLNIGDASINAAGYGGRGGDGGSADGGTGGDGGNGGAAIGGFVNVGTSSGPPSIAQAGVANFNSITVDAGAFGGDGGNGGIFGAPDGNGGNGGSATGGTAGLLVRGSTLNVNSVGLFADAVGGNGGSGAVVGDGGDATGGAIRVLVTKRFEDVTRGQLNAGSIIGNASATGGTGAMSGASLTGGGSWFQVTDSDASIGSLAFTITAADGNAPGAPENAIRIINGEVFVLDFFSFITPGDISLYLANEGLPTSLTVGNLILTAGDFVADSINPSAGNPGTIFADNLFITTGNNFIADANIDTVNDLAITAPGSIQFDQAISDGSVMLWAQGGSISIEGVDAGAALNLLAATSVGTDDILAGTTVTIGAQGGSVGVGHIVAGGDVNLSAASFAEGDDISTPGNIFVQTSNGNIDFQNLTGFDVTLDSGNSILLSGIVDAGGDVDFNAIGAITALNILVPGGFIEATAGGPITLGDLNAGGNVLVDSTGGPVSIGDVTGAAIDLGALTSLEALNIVGSSFVADAGGALTVGNVNSTNQAAMTAGGALTAGNVDAGTFISATGSSVSLGNLTAGGNVFVDATGPAGATTVGNVVAGSSVHLEAVGAIDADDVTATTFIEMLAGGNIDFGALIAGTTIDIAAGGSIDGGNIDAGGDVTLDAGGTLATGTIDGGNVLATANGNLLTGDINGFDITLTSLTGDVTAGNLVAFDAAILDADGNLSFGNVAAFVVDLTAGGAINGGNIDSVTDIIAVAGTDIDLGDLDAGGSVALTAGGDIGTGIIFAFGDVGLDALGSIFTGDITGSTIDAFAGGDITTGDLTTVELLALSDGGITILSHVPGVSIWLESGGDIATGDISSRDSVHAQAVGGIATGAIDAVGFVELFGGLNISTADILAGDYIDVFTSGGTIALGDLDAGLQIELNATGAISFGNALASDFDFDSGGSVTGGNIVASELASGQAEGAVTLGNITAGLANPQFTPDDGFSVGIASATSITVGDVAGEHSVGFATFGPLVTGDISAGEGFMALVGGNMTLGSIATDADGQVYLADASMFINAGGPDNFDPSLVLALEPVATGGSISIGGPVSTGLFQAAAGTDLSAGAITAQTIEASAGGTATVAGNWSAQEIILASNDIDITASGFLDAGLTGPLTLISTNVTQALIGDGLTGTGYTLSNAEFGRLHGGAVSIIANGDASAAADMLIGDLSITGPLAGSTTDNPNGIVVFATGDLDTLTPGGVIRVVGDVEATGFGSGNALEFLTGRFELDAATGSISVEGLSNALGGILDITADRIHVASGSILDQLATNPHYAGYQDDLNDPATVQRPDGVIRASSIFVQPAQAVLVQNTGTNDVPAGFVANSVELTALEGTLPGSIELIVNGQVITETGTLTKIAVRDALVAEFDISVFTDNSTINGCQLTGACIDVPETPSIPRIPGIPTQVTLISEDMLDEQLFGNEPVIDDEDDDETSSPIQPPAPLFDTRPLNPDAEVDEPISGSGNPALIGAGPVNSGDQQ